MEDRYLTAREAAKFLAVDRRQIIKLILAGKLPAKSVGVGQRPVYRILLSDLVTFNTPDAN